MQFDQLKRREFITLLGAGAAAWPFTARAQSRERVGRIGVTAAALRLSSALFSLGMAVTFPAVVKAHDIYTTLKDGSGRSCCNNHDCRPAHYRLSSTGVQMLVSGEWIVVPNAAIQYRTLEGDTGETAGGHWCGLSGGFATVTYCAILPPSSASVPEGKPPPR